MTYNATYDANDTDDIVVDFVCSLGVSFVMYAGLIGVLIGIIMMFYAVRDLKKK